MPSRRPLGIETALLYTCTPLFMLTCLQTQISMVRIPKGQMFNLWSSPVRIIISIVLLYRELGAAAFVALGILIIMIPIQKKFVSVGTKLFKKSLASTDKRVSLISEVMGSMEIIKCYAWEPSVRARIWETRDVELKYIKQNALIRAVNMFFISAIPILVTFFTFLTFILIPGNTLTASVAFTSLSLFSVLRMPLITLPQVIDQAIQTSVALGRLQKMLTSDALGSNDAAVAKASKGENAIVIDKSDYRWSKETAPVLHAVGLEVPAGQLLAVIGKTGSGKSSLLAVALGETMPPVSNSASPALVRGSTAYVSQQAWIFNATVRENILFGRRYNEERYRNAVHVSALSRDFEMMEDGDMTEIGEKGVNLSGGQKQRVSIARAVYADADVILLDDPLSALDAHVAKEIFDQCICGHLKGKTIVFVTNRLEFVSGCDRVCMVESGSIVADGAYNDLMQSSSAFRELMQDAGSVDGSTAVESKDEKGVGTTEAPGTAAAAVGGGSIRDSSASKIVAVKSGGLNADPKDIKALPSHSLIKEEKREKGAVGLGLIADYARASGGISVVVAILISFLGIEAARLGASLWISKWANSMGPARNHTPISGQHDQFGPDAAASMVGDASITATTKSSLFYIGIYGAISGGQALLTLLNLIYVAFVSVAGGRTLHSNMMHALLRAPMAFFHATPLGRIINRISKDTSNIDRQLASMTTIFLRGVVQILGTLVIIGISTPYTLVTFVPLIAMFYWTYRYFQSTNRELKRLDSIARSPIYAYFEQCLNGLPTIRAYRAEMQVAEVSARRLDDQTRFTLALFSSNRWLSVRLELLGGFMILICAAFLVAGRHVIDQGTVGLALSYALQITGLLNMTVRLAAMAENSFNAVERVQEYAAISSEKVDAPDGAPMPPPNWPSAGAVHFEKVSMKYREHEKPVLNALDFAANPGQKIGIVGRTGAGKSSTFLTLFRIVEPCSGTITIDGIDISQLSLHALRSKLSIIPQDPVLFTGSIRYNLDPFDQHDDATLIHALERAHLKEFVDTKPGGLDFLISENGENFSVGQRQLLCLARALIRQSPILVLDEATAGVDVLTDALIQKTIREEFKDRTVLAIAHRLNTIIDSDMILVLDAGQRVEYGSPAELLQNEKSVFASMVNDTGPENAQFLQNVAFGKEDLGASIEKVVSEGPQSGHIDASKAVRLHGLSTLKDVQFQTPVLEETRHALLQIKASLLGSTSSAWYEALETQNVTELTWLGDLREVLQQLVGLASERMARFDPDHSPAYGEGHEHELALH